MNGGSLRAAPTWRLLCSSFLGSSLWALITYTPQRTTIEGPMVSIRWYLGSLNGLLGGAGRKQVTSKKELQRSLQVP